MASVSQGGRGEQKGQEGQYGPRDQYGRGDLAPITAPATAPTGGTWVPLLLSDPSPCLRLLVLRELLGRPADDAEVRELLALREADPLVADLLRTQGEDGAWDTVDPVSSSGSTRATSQALMRLGHLGFGPAHPAVGRGAEALFALQTEDGAWPLAAATDGEGREGYDMVPLQTALPLRALAMAGYATDPRAERAYEWLLAQRLPDGAWPTGLASGTYGRVAGYRRLAHSRWGCRSNTTGALLCLAYHPERRTGAAARRALDLLLGRETREVSGLGFEVARLIGAERARGFFTYYARFDLALLLDLCWRVGATLEDGRVADLVAFVAEARGPYGLWEYAPRPQTSRWLTFTLLRALSALSRTANGSTDWLSLEPRTPFQAYSKKLRRY